jgi:hypothetical protein
LSIFLTLITENGGEYRIRTYASISQRQFSKLLQ